MGYAPSKEANLLMWKQKSLETWRLQDSIFPGSCTGALVKGQLISSAGTLPIAASILYGHSYCMVKTVDAAATLFAQSLHSINAMETFPEVDYWAGQYAHHSRFTSLFQRPVDGPITDQLEVETIRLVEPLLLVSNAKSALVVEPLRHDQVFSLAPHHQEFFRRRSAVHERFASIHTITPLTLRDGATEKIMCLVLAQNAPAEFTASNVFSYALVFPLPGTSVNSNLVRALRSLPQFQVSGLQIILNAVGDYDLDDLNEPLIPTFYALAPRSQLGALRESFGSAFCSLLDRYPSEDLMRVIVQRTDR